MKFTVQQIADLLGADLQGDPNASVDHFSKIEEGDEGGISFLANPKYEAYIYETQATAVIVARDFHPKQEIGTILLKVDDPYVAFTSMLDQYAKLTATTKAGVDEMAFVDPSANIAEGAYVGAFSYIAAGAELAEGVQVYPQVYVGEGVKVGAGTILYPHSTIYHGCEIGKNCIVHAGARIGSDGFGFAPQEDGTFQKIPQTGIVVLEDGVEVGANACIDRATIGQTTIRKGAKLDNLVQIAHNVEVGPSSAIAAQSGIAGSTKVGEGCMLGGQVGVVGHIKIAAGTKIDAQSGVNHNIEKPGQAFRGSPIQPFRQQLKSEVMFRRLAEMGRRIEQLERALAKRDGKSQ